MAPLRQSVPSLSPSANIPGLGEALREHFDRAPVGILLFGNDRRIVAANEALAKLSGIAAVILPGSHLRRFLWSEEAGDLETRIFEEGDPDARWVGGGGFRSSLGDSCPMTRALAEIPAPPGAHRRYIGTLL